MCKRKCPVTACSTLYFYDTRGSDKTCNPYFQVEPLRKSSARPAWASHLRSSGPASAPTSPQTISRNNLLERHRFIMRQHNRHDARLSLVMLCDFGYPYLELILSPGWFPSFLRKYNLSNSFFHVLILSHVAFLLLTLLEEDISVLWGSHTSSLSLSLSRLEASNSLHSRSSGFKLKPHWSKFQIKSTFDILPWTCAPSRTQETFYI